MNWHQSLCRRSWFPDGVSKWLEWWMVILWILRLPEIHIHAQHIRMDCHELFYRQSCTHLDEIKSLYHGCRLLALFYYLFSFLLFWKPSQSSVDEDYLHKRISKDRQSSLHGPGDFSLSGLQEAKRVRCTEDVRIRMSKFIQWSSWPTITEGKDRSGENSYSCKQTNIEREKWKDMDQSWFFQNPHTVKVLCTPI